MNKRLYMLLLAMASLPLAMAETITGKVLDANGNPITGAKVFFVNNPSVATITNGEGVFALEESNHNYIAIQYGNRYEKRLWIDEESNGKAIALGERDRVEALELVTRSTARKTQSMQTIYAEDLELNGASTAQELYNGLFTSLSGTNIRTLGGALCLVDGFERTLENVNVKDIESITLLKDAAATALYGVRGANGVLLITTKRGAYNSFEVEVNYQYGMGTPINMPEMLDAASYAQAVNEAAYYDNYYGMSGAPENATYSVYTPQEIALFRDGTGDADLYPNVNWLEAGLRDNTMNHRFDLLFRGGGNRVRYYSSIDYKNDFGLYDTSYAAKSNIYNGQNRNYDLNLRTNLDIDVTPSTLLKINLHGRLRQSTTAKEEYANLVSNLYKIPSAAFPIHTTSGEWGGSDIFKYNPIAQMGVNGYNKSDMIMLRSDMRLTQDLSTLTPGLKAEVAVAFDNTAIYQEAGTQGYAIEINNMGLNDAGELVKKPSLEGENTILKIANTGLNNQYMRTTIAGNISWDRAFNQHNLSAVAQYKMESNQPTGTAMRRTYLNGVVGYNYADKYLVDGVLTYSASSLLPKGQKYKLYPALSAAWVLSNESFLQGTSVNHLKLRASYGESGLDNIPYYLDKQYWQATSGYTFGDAMDIGGSGLKEGDIANPNVTLMRDYKYNLGVDFTAWKGLSITADAFYNQRRDMLIDGSKMISTVIGTNVAQINNGAQDFKGVELSARWNDKLGNFSYYVGGNASFITSEIIENGEGFQLYDYQSRIGNPVSQMYGLEQVGYFQSWEEINNLWTPENSTGTPAHKYGDVRPGDIRYKDQNGDGVIDDFDIVAIGGTTTPQLFYGLQAGFTYRGFGIDAVFQGTSMGYAQMNLSHIHRPLANNRNISTWYWNSEVDGRVRWTENTQESANLPRLTTTNAANNFRNSTQWMVRSDYFKLRNLNIHYDLSERALERLKMEQMRIYLSANNLFSIDDRMYESNGLPEMMSFYAGVSVKF